MKAILHTKYGPPDLLELTDVEKPTPKENQVLVKVHASSINAADYRTMRADPFLVRLIGEGVLKPKDPRFGRDVAGIVEAAGPNVTQFRPGDEVFGCARGAFAEYVLARESYLALKPANRSFEEAAAVPVGALTALQGLRDTAGIQPGQKVLIQGASGSVGVFAVQLAKFFGAEVTAVCSTRNLDMVRSIGADHVIDYTREDFTRNGQRYDLILAANGYHPISAYLRALSPEGIYVVAGGSMLQLFQATLQGRKTSKTAMQKTYVASLVQNQKDLVFVKELLESEKVVSVIDGCYQLSKTAEALWYFEKEHAQGKVVITM